MTSKTVFINTDGGSRGNPGPSGCAYVIHSAGVVLSEGKYFLGAMTNNQAEYWGAFCGLTRALDMGISDVTLVMDSELVIRQLRGEYRVKDAGLRQIFQSIQALIQRFHRIEYVSVPRAQNARADMLANQAMDDEFPLFDLSISVAHQSPLF